MDNFPAVKQKIIRHSVMMLIFLASALLIHFIYVNRGIQSAYLRDQVQDVMHEKESIMQNILTELTDSQTEDLSFQRIYEQVHPSITQQPGIALLLYQKDSLVYWSENRVPAIRSPRDNLPGKPFIRHGNGWYRIMTAVRNDVTAVAMLLVKSDYPYQNDYLLNDFATDFGLPSEVTLDTIAGSADIFSREGEYLFSLHIPEHTTVSESTELLVTGLGILAFISLIILLFNLYRAFSFFIDRPLLLVIAFLADALILRGIFLYFKIPGFIYETDLFGPFHFATSAITPSLGDFLFNSVFWLTLALLFFENIDPAKFRLGKYTRFIIQLIVPLLSAILFLLLMGTIRNMVLDSSLVLDFNELFNIDLYSGLGLLGLSCLVMAYFLFTARMLIHLIRSGIRQRTFIVSSVLMAILVFIIVYFSGNSWLAIASGVFILIYLLAFLYFSGRAAGYRDIAAALFFIVMFSVIATFHLDIHHAEKEKVNRQILAAELASRRDPVMEFEFAGIREQIMTDTLLLAMAEKGMSDNLMDDRIMGYVQEKYFNSLWNKYDLVLTVCRPDEVLNIRPAGYIAPCFDYFDDYFKDSGTDSIAPGLFFNHNAPAGNSYMAKFEFVGPGNRELRIFAELYFKYFSETGLGYPDLLIDRNVSVLSRLTDYSYARYLDNQLIYKNGDFAYQLIFNTFDRPAEDSYFMDFDAVNHLVLKLDDRNSLIISRKSQTLLGWVAPFSYLFIIFTLFLMLFLTFQLARQRIHFAGFSFGNQLQLAVISIIVIAFIILGVITRSNIIHLYDNKNKDNLNEKTLSVLTEIEHKIGDMPEISAEMQPYLADLLYKFSLIFFSDINIYDPEGNLIATSRPQIFDEELLSTKIQPDAYFRLTIGQSLIFIQEERIGEQEYLSAYMPFRNSEDRIIAYLNLPYFARQTELRKELSDFLSAYINVYVLLIVLAVMLTILVSRLITRPLMLIREKLGGIGLGKTNEKIEWERKDEIGSLVEEYNRMIDELSRSADLLARSERESAWREMARQVAHEIKNPLTPMKLSVQYLQKAWNEKSPDFDKRLEGFTRTIIEQIEALSEIASEFSDFAKMPAARPEKIDLPATIRAAADLYYHRENIRFELDFPEHPCRVKADKKQILRVFNNLIQNATEAIGKKEGGVIRISVTTQDEFYRVDVADNGSGITEEQARRIFSPSFTTKTSGMGLGLAMVRSIVTSIGGDVSFESQPGSGATFSLLLPKYDD